MISPVPRKESTVIDGDRGIRDGRDGKTSLYPPPTGPLLVSAFPADSKTEFFKGFPGGLPRHPTIIPLPWWALTKGRRKKKKKRRRRRRRDFPRVGGCFRP